MDIAKMKDIVMKQVDAVNRHDADAFVNGYTPDAILHDPQYPEPLKGRDAIRKDIVDTLQAFPDMHNEVKNLTTNDDTIAFEMETTGTHLGPLITPNGSMPATNKKITIHGSRVMHLTPEGLIVSCNRYYDQAGIMMQLGLMQE